MLRLNSFFAMAFSAVALLFFTTPVLAGGWPIYNYGWDNPNQWPNSGMKMSYIRTHLAPDVPCKGTTVTFRYGESQGGDNVSASGPNGSHTFTEDMLDCGTYAKFFSSNNSQKTAIIEFKTAEGKVYSSRYILNFQLPTPGNTEPEEKDPLPWKLNTPVPTSKPIQIIKGSVPILRIVNPNWYVNLDRSSRNFGRAVALELENYRLIRAEDWQTYKKSNTDSNWQEAGVSTSGPSYIIWTDPYKDYEIRSKVCQNGNTAWASKNCGEFSNIAYVSRLKSATSSYPETSINPVLLPAPSIQPTANTVQESSTVTVSSDTAQLQKKVENLQKQLEESQKRQASLEQRVNNLIKWIKSFFPFFK